MLSSVAGSLSAVNPSTQQGRIMKTQTLLVVLTAVNLGLLSYQVVHPRPSVAARADVPNVIRGRALEIVDDRGRVRASLSVLPEDPKVKWNGKPYPETVLLRLITADGRPNVKLGASKLGSGLVIGGESNPTYVQVLAEGGESTLKLINKDGVERLIKP
jgi:hypothetical protein